MTGILIKRGHLDAEIHREGRQCKETEGEDGQEERPGIDSTPEPSEGGWPSSPLISDF